MPNQHKNLIRILAVEDDPIYAKTISMVIEGAGYELIAVPNTAEEAIRLVRDDRPDLILVDINLAGKWDGMDLMKALDPEIPVIVITSIRDQKVFDELKKLRPAAFLLKPFDSFALINHVELALAMSVGKDEAVWENEDLILKDSFYIKEKKSLIKVSINDIQYIQSEDKYCTLFTKKRKFVLRIQLKSLLEMIPDHFIQVHRSFVVDIHLIEHIHLDDYLLKVDNTEIPIGMTYREPLLKRLKKL